VRRGAFSIALLAALLLGAPSVVLAAPPNRLEAGTASPVSGTPLTVFELSVRYVSTAGNPATGVSALAGSVAVPLTLADGTAVDGTWRGTIILPVGTWPVTYQATSNKGPRPTLSGPTLTVATAAEGHPATNPHGKPADEQPSPSASSKAEDAPRAAAPAGSPHARPRTRGGGGSGSPTPQPAPRGAGHRASDQVTPEPAPGTTRRHSDNGRRRGGAAPVSRTPQPSLADGDAPLVVEPGATGPDDLLLLVAIVTVATIALLGTGWLLGVRDETTSESAGAEARERAERRRRARRVDGESKVHPAHDPVLAAMGLERVDDPPADPARGVARGAVPRPRKAPRGRR
jgi:hypothetical protein